MNEPATSFVFTAEMGAWLRQARVRAGLSQAEVMRRAGRMGKGAANLASRLETGKDPLPSLSLVADYLRSCRTTFAEVADVLDTYTRRLLPATELVRQAVQAVLPESDATDAALAYDSKGQAKDRALRKKPVAEEARIRVERALKVAREFALARIANRELERVLSEESYGLGEPELRGLGRFGRRVFSMHSRYSTDSRRDMRARRRATDHARERAAEQVGKRPEIALVELAMVALCAELKKHGTLAGLVMQDHGEQLAVRSESQWRCDAARESQRWLRGRQHELEQNIDHQRAQVFMAANRVLETCKADWERYKLARWLVDELTLLASAVRAEDERAQKVEELAGRWDNPEQVRLAAREAFAAQALWQRSVDQARQRYEAASAAMPEPKPEA